MFRPCLRPLLHGILALACLGGARASAGDGNPSVADYPSIQAALDANLGRQVFLPAGDYAIDKAIEIRGAGSGLFGPGRIVQGNPDAPIAHVIEADGAQLRDLTLTRAAGSQDTKQKGLLAEACRDLVLDNVQVIDNRGGLSVRISGCFSSQIRNCLVRNYTGVAVDDRMQSPAAGYAFNCIDGTGIQVDNSVGTLLQGNRVIEGNLFATPELQQKHQLGRIVQHVDQPPSPAMADLFRRGSVNNWHQGSAIHVSNPWVTDYTQLIGNYIENAGQGLDVHGDHVVISGNIIRNAFMGMKVMHGARNVAITGNQISGADLWGILVQPGSLSHPGHDATTTETAKAPNVDGGTVIANNVISDFGFGNEYWIWKNEDSEMAGVGIFLHAGQEPDDPPLRDVILIGNLVYDAGRDGVIENGRVTRQGPRYKYALYVTQGDRGPQNVVIANNIFNPGLRGVSNIELKPNAGAQ